MRKTHAIILSGLFILPLATPAWAFWPFTVKEGKVKDENQQKTSTTIAIEGAVIAGKDGDHLASIDIVPDGRGGIKAKIHGLSGGSVTIREGSNGGIYDLFDGHIKEGPATKLAFAFILISAGIAAFLFLPGIGLPLGAASISLGLGASPLMELLGDVKYGVYGLTLIILGYCAWRVVDRVRGHHDTGKAFRQQVIALRRVEGQLMVQDLTRFKSGGELVQFIQSALMVGLDADAQQLIDATR